MDERDRVVLRVPVSASLARRLGRLADALGTSAEEVVLRAVEASLPTMEQASGAARALTSCPRCAGRSLRQGARGDVHVTACLTCGGVWLDNVSAQALLARPPSGIEHVAHAVSKLATKKAQTHARLKCPICERTMERTHVASGGVTIDGCRPHGVFFDDGELEQCVDAIRRRVREARPLDPAEIELQLGSIIELADRIRDDSQA